MSEITPRISLAHAETCPACRKNAYIPVGVDLDGFSFTACLACGYEIERKLFSRGNSEAGHYQETFRERGLVVYYEDDTVPLKVSELPAADEDYPENTAANAVAMLRTLLENADVDVFYAFWIEPESKKRIWLHGSSDILDGITLE